MDKQDAYKLVVDHLSQRFQVPEDRITPDAHIFNTLGLDSIDALDMLALLDKQWSIKINEEQAKKIRTVQDVVDYILANLPPDAEQKLADPKAAAAS
jgi:acyl carrier protein